MVDILHYGIKGCIGAGTMVLATGLIAQFVPTTQTEAVFGDLDELLLPPFRSLYKVIKFYPHTHGTFARIVDGTTAFVQTCMKPKTVKNTRALLRLQSLLFEHLDHLRIELSESTALEDIYNVTDDLKQTITDICLRMDI